MALLVTRFGEESTRAGDAGEGSAVTTAASPGDPSDVPARRAATASTAPAPGKAWLELQQLKEAVEVQNRLLAERAQELESERANLQRALDRIAALESEMRGGSLDAESNSVISAPASSRAVAPAAGSALAAAPAAETGAAPSNPAPSIPARQAAIASPQPAAQQPAPGAQGNVDTRLNDLARRLAAIGPLTFGGDFRLRDEPFFGGPADESLYRNRERYRLRFNVDTRLNDGISGGFSLASGDVNDPITTNQTAGGFYTRRPFNLDKAFIQYTPSFGHLILVGGKFAYPWYNTELTWDKDLNPEGLGQTLAFDLKSTPALKRVAFVGFELPFAEVAGVSLGNRSVVQSIVYGGQWQTEWRVAPWLTFSAYSSFYNFHNADPIALALAKANTKNPQTPLDGLSPLGCSGCTAQNSVVTTTSSSVVTVNGTSIPTGVTSIAGAQFASKFELFDNIGRLDVRTPWGERWPVQFIGDFVQNMGACANTGNIQKAPANTSTALFSQSINFSCDPRARRGYWGEVVFGRIKQAHDWQFGYTHIFIEREAVLSNFDYSEMFQGSSVTEHRASIFYTVNRNVVLDFNALIGRPLIGTGQPSVNWLKRLQFDANYVF